MSSATSFRPWSKPPTTCRFTNTSCTMSRTNTARPRPSCPSRSRATTARACTSTSRSGSRAARLPDRLVDVHARAVVALDRLGHEGRGLAVLVRDIVHDVFVNLHVVGGFDQGRKDVAELMLRGGDLVMVLFDLEPHVEHHREHLGPEVGGAVDRRHR